MATIEDLKRKLRSRISVRDDCLARRKQKLMEAEGELQTALKFDREVVSLMCEIKWLEERR